MVRDELKIGVKMTTEMVMVAIRTCYRSASNHPFLAGILLFLIMLYRSFPSLFSLLVSASPVLVCTAVLLGMLLSFGQPDIPDLEKDKKIATKISPSKTGRLENTTVVERGERFGKDVGYTAVRREIVDEAIEEAPLLDDSDRVDRFEQDVVSHDSVHSYQKSREVRFEKQMSEEGNSGYEKFEIEQLKKGHRETEEVEAASGDNEVFEDQYSQECKLGAENLEDHSSVEGSADLIIGDGLESSLGPWKQIDGDHGSGDDNDDDLDYESDGDESSSPDASMADIIPMLDELHPLLDSENPLPAHLSHESFAVSFEGSNKSPESNVHSVAESDHQEEEDGAVEDENDDDEDEDEDEETQGGKEDVSQSVITWTEDDQKNLMDLGSSELERNQRLESLIARRRARQNLRMMAEKNLIDLDGLDLPFQVPTISTRRHNPFDLPRDTYDSIPSSAPSVLQPRRNPFDLPYDSSEEKPDLMTDSFQQEFMEFDSKEPLFHRHESFSVGSSSFEFPRHENRDVSRATWFRPYFMTEGMASEGTSYSSFHRLPSDLSESKLSSVAETESTSAVVDKDEMKMIDYDNYTEQTKIVLDIDHASDHVEKGSQASEDVDSISDNLYDKRDFNLNVPEIQLGEVEIYPSSGSQTSPVTKLGNREICPAAVLWMFEGEPLLACAEIPTVDTHLMEAIEEKHHISSSSSLLEKHYNDVNRVEADESLVNVGKQGPEFVGDSCISAEHSMDASNSTHTGEVNESKPNFKDPVYDLSPTTVKNLSSIDSILQIETSEVNLSANEQKDLSESKESEVCNEDLEKNSYKNKEILSSTWEMKGTSGHDNMKLEFAGVNEDLGHLNVSMMPEHFIHLGSSFSDARLVEKVIFFEEEVSKSEEHQTLTQYYDTGAQVAVHEDDSLKMPPEDPTFSALVENQTPASVEHVSVLSNFSSLETELIEEAKMEEENLHFQASSYYSKNCVNVAKNDDNMLVSARDEGNILTDNSFIRPSSYNEEQEQSIINWKLEDISDVDKVNENETVSVVKPPEFNIVSDNIEYSPPEEHMENLGADLGDLREPIQESAEIDLSPAMGGTDIPSEVGHSADVEDIIYEELSDSKEMDDRLLSELDVVGDFSMKDLGLDLNHTGNCSDPKVNTGMPEQDIHKLETIAGMPFSDVIPLAEDAGMEKHDPVAERYDNNLTAVEVSNLNSHSVETNTASLVFEAQSIEDNHAAFKGTTDADEKTAITESSQNELIREGTQLGSPEYELLEKEAELGIPLTETITPVDHAVEFRESNIDSQSEEIYVGMQVLDARSIADIDAAFKGAGKAEVEKAVIAESFHSQDDLVKEESQHGSPEYDLPDGKQELGIPITETITLEDLFVLQKDEPVAKRGEDNLSGEPIVERSQSFSGEPAVERSKANFDDSKKANLYLNTQSAGCFNQPSEQIAEAITANSDIIDAQLGVRAGVHCTGSELLRKDSTMKEISEFAIPDNVLVENSPQVEYLETLALPGYPMIPEQHSEDHLETLSMRVDLNQVKSSTEIKPTGEEAASQESTFGFDERTSKGVESSSLLGMQD